MTTDVLKTEFRTATLTDTAAIDRRSTQLSTLRRALCLCLILSLGVFGGAATAAAQDLDDYTFYRSHGYASLLAVDAEGDIFFLQETADSLLVVGEGVLEGDVLYTLDDEGDEPLGSALFFDVEASEAGYVAFARDGTRRVFDRLAAPPEQPLIIEEAFDPELDFDVFWQLIAENSIYLELQGLDWNDVYGTYRPQIDADTTRDELFDVLASMLTLLGDAHHGVLLDDELERQFAVVEPQPSEWMLERAPELLSLIEDAVDDELQAVGNGLMAYGTFDEGRIGYLTILSFFGFSDDLTRDTEVFTAALDEALTALADTESLVLDLRWNRGGFSHLPRVLMSRFTDVQRLAYRKNARWADDVTAVQEIFYGPQGVRYTGGRPIIGLVSDLTSSAGELAAAMLRDLQTARLVGAPTLGRFSSGLDLALPGGFTLRASNERYFWGPAPGLDLEGQGLVPDVVLVPSEAALDQGVDNVLHRVLDDLTDGSAGCVASPTVLCLDDGRYAAQVEWQDFAGRTGAGQAAPLTSQSGSFWFFGPENLELVVKVIDGEAVNGHTWVFHASLTNVAFSLTVTDTLSGAQRVYNNPSGRFASGGDTLAFPR